MANSILIKRFSLRQWLRYHILQKKLNTAFGWILLLLLGALMVYGVVMVDYKIGPIVIVCVSAFLLFVLIMKYPYFGLYFLIGFSSITTVIDRLVTLPVPSGTFIELITYLEFLSILFKYDQKKNIDLKFWKNPITIGLYVLFGFYLIELFNPEMFSQLGWFSFFRKQLSYFVFYYICYSLLDSRARIIYFVRFMIFLCTLLALYACKQQAFGYAGFEMRWIGTGGGLSLLLQGGLLRKFSVFSDPATSGILFASISMLCIILFIRSDDKKERVWLAVAGIINLLGYSYSGTRTATLMIIAGICLYCISTLYEKRTIRFFIYSVLTVTALMVMPYQNVVTNRIRSTFEGTKDQSAAIRDFDRHQVQPYIQDHPLGGGIFTCGFEGPKYNHGHYLEYLQPDSGYMKTVAEEGGIGLALLLIFYFIVMRHGYHYFFRAKDPVIRNYYIALLIMMFTLLVAQYAQMAITQCPVVLFFQAIMVIFIKLADYDTDPQAKPITTIQN